MTADTYAAGHPKEEHGWFIFPRDLKERRSLIPESIQQEVSNHPAKMNLTLCQELVKYVSEPGQRILDPFGGVGTTMIAALPLGRRVLLVEVEQHYHELQQATLKHLEERGIAKPGDAMLVNQSCTLFLPTPIKYDHIITSPPYGKDLNTSSAVNEKVQAMVDQYTSHPQNIGNLNPFLYVQTMNKVYEKMVAGLPSGGTISITHRDRRKGDERILYAAAIIKVMTGTLKMKLKNWDKWKAPGSIQSRVNEAQGVESILDEDILTFVKP